jgi:hypothetical protein
MEGIWILIIAIILVRFVPERKSTPSEFKGISEALIALLVGVAFALLGTYWFSRYHIVGDTLSSDLYDFCGSVAAMRDGPLTDFSRDRSFAAGYLPSLLSRQYGVANGLVISGILSLGVIGTGLYIWGRALNNRLSGLLAVICALSLAPVVLLGRTITFYPEYVAVFTLASGLTCLAIRERRPIFYFLAGVSVASCLLVDLRGVVWAVPLTLAALLAAFALRSKKSLALVLLFALPIGGSWSIGDQVYTHRSTSLDAQANPVRLFYEHGTPRAEAPTERLREDSGAFVWGRTPLSSIPTTLYNLAIDTRTVAPLMSTERVVIQGRDAHLTPLFIMGVVTFIGALISLIRRPLYLAGFLLSSGPFLAVLYHSSHLEFRHRFAASGLPVLAVFFGLTVAAAIQSPLPKRIRFDELERRFGRVPKLRATLIAIIISVAVAGILPSKLSPIAEWRTPFVADNELERMIAAARAGTSLEVWGSQPCIDGLAADIEAGRPVGATIIEQPE